MGSSIGWPLAVLAILAFAVLFSMHYQYPGLFMDSVNPEYLASRILYHASAQYNHVSIVPGNLIHDRFPVLAGSFYHGPLQLYTSLPIYYALDTTITSARVAQGMYGVAILLVSAGLLRRSGMPAAIAFVVLLLLAVDPAFMQIFKTQALSTVWPLSLLLASVYINERWALSGRAPKAWELIASGALAGLAFFSYFIYLFFVPAILLHLLMASRSVPRKKGLWKVFVVYSLGYLVGCIPYFIGFGLLFSRFDGWASFFAYLTGAANDLQVTNQGVGWAHRFIKLSTSWKIAMDDSWVSLMVFQQAGATFLGAWKPLLLAMISLLGVVAGRHGPGERRLPLFFAAAWIGFILMALPLGSRLDGHHYVVLLPCLYLSAAFSARALLARDYRSAPKELAPIVLGACMLLLSCEAIFTQVAFQGRLVRTRGVGAYSATINDLSTTALKHPDEVYAFPDWGFFMPFAFLTHGKVAYKVDPAVSRENVLDSVCKGRPFNLVRAGDGWVGRDAVASLDVKRASARTLVPEMVPQTQRYSHQDGSPIFEVHRFELAKGQDAGFCGIYALPRCSLSVAARGAGLDATPCSMSLCPNTPPEAVQIAWQSGDSNIESTEIWVSSNATSPKKLWMKVAGSGKATTGPWAGPGNVFELRQAGSGKPLATRTLGGLECRTSR
ncbi:MAG: hypothetical protein ABI538_00150 [Pseudoxanthomonas sp.]